MNVPEKKVRFDLTNSQPRKKPEPPIAAYTNAVNTKDAGDNHKRILDSGATGHFITANLDGGYEDRTADPIMVKCANDTYIRLVATDKMTIPTLPYEATQCHKFATKDLATTLISAPQFARSGCTTLLYPDKAQVLNPKGEVVVTGQFNKTKGTYEVDLKQLGITAKNREGTFTTNNYGGRPVPDYTDASAHRAEAYYIKAVPDLIKYLHATAGFPVKSTWLQAVKKGYYIGWPGLTPGRIQRHLHKSEHTTYGHLELVRQGIRSTKQVHNEPAQPGLMQQREEQEITVEATPALPRNKAHRLGVYLPDVTDFENDIKAEELKGLIASDLPGRYPVTSARGHKYLFLLYDYDSNYIQAVPIRSRNAQELIRGFQETYKVLTRRGFTAKSIRLDNEISKDFVATLEDPKVNIKYQLVAPSDHRQNPAERAIRSYKNHFIATLSGTPDDFPTNCWDLLVPQANITLNLARASRLQPSLSAYAQIHGNYDFNATPLAPAGCRVIIHDRPKDRRTWAKHGTPGFYIGPAPHHYRSYTCYNPVTKSTRISNTVEFFPTCCTMPRLSSTDRLTAVLQELKGLLTRPSPATPFLTNNFDPRQDIETLIPAIEHAQLGPRVNQNNEQSIPTDATLKRPTKATPKAETHQPPRVVTARTQHRPTLHRPYAIGTIVRKRFEDGRHYEGEVISYDETNKWYKIKYLDGMHEDLDEVEMKRYYKRLQRYAPQQLKARATYATNANYDHNFNYNLFPASKTTHSALAAGGTVWDAELNKMAHYRDLIIHPNPEIQRRWMESGENEFGRLFQGYREVSGMDVLDWIRRDEVPEGKDVTYARYTVAFRPEKLEKHRTRITGGGDKLTYNGDVATHTASLETFKLLLNSTISTPGAKMCTADISNMYLYSSLDNCEFVRFKVSLIPPNIIKHYNLESKIHNGYVYARIKKAWYGLKQSGRIAHDDLVKHLAEHGYKKMEYTECLFKHEDRDIAFALVVDDFAIKYTDKQDADHLVEIMQKKYPYKVDWEAKQFIGIHMKWDYQAREVQLSMDGYVEQALKELEHPIPKQHHYAPSKMKEPTYGQKVQFATEDNSPTVSPELETFIQKVTGKFLYYARAIDNTMLHALNDIASSKRTEDTLQATKYFLDYAASNPNGTIIYRKSDMVLQGDSDAAYLVCPEARSRAGGYIFVGNKNRTTFNGPILVLAKVIKNVMASAAEAEVAALYLNAQEMVPMRQCLIELGHPQPPTPLKTDNSTATGIVTGTIKQKRSKAIDMRFYWLKDRVKQGQFEVYWEPGVNNLADYPTKHHSSKHHKDVRPIYLYEGENSPRTVQGCIKILNSMNSSKGKTKVGTQGKSSPTYPITRVSDSVALLAATTRRIQSLASSFSH